MNYNCSVLKDEIERLWKNKVSVKVFTINGYQLKGVIVNWDDECIKLRSSTGSVSTVLMHAVSTITKEV